MKLVRCKRCKDEHQCAGRMSNVERARKAAGARMRKVVEQFVESPLQAQTPHKERK